MHPVVIQRIVMAPGVIFIMVGIDVVMVTQPIWMGRGLGVHGHCRRVRRHSLLVVLLLLLVLLVLLGLVLLLLLLLWCLLLRCLLLLLLLLRVMVLALVILRRGARACAAWFQGPEHTCGCGAARISPCPL